MIKTSEGPLPTVYVTRLYEKRALVQLYDYHLSVLVGFKYTPGKSTFLLLPDEIQPSRGLYEHIRSVIDDAILERDLILKDE